MGWKSGQVRMWSMSSFWWEQPKGQGAEGLPNRRWVGHWLSEALRWEMVMQVFFICELL